MKIYDLNGNLVPSIGSAVPEPPTANSLQDILHKDTNYTYAKGTDSLEGISDDIDKQHLNIHILFILPEAVGSITADNIAIRVELQKLGDVITITQADALEFPGFGGFAMAVMGTDNGAASWTTDNLADLKKILGLVLLCVDKTSAAYFQIGTDGGDATTKTVIRAISEIKGTKMGFGDDNHMDVTGLAAGNNTVTTDATYHTLNMANALITEAVYCTEANDPDDVTAKEDVVLGVIRRIQNDGSIGTDEDGADVPATLAFAGFAYEADKLTTLGKGTFLLFAHMLVQTRIQEAAVETGGLVADLRKRLLGNMKGSFTNTAPLAEYIAGENSVGGKLPVGTSLADLITTIDGIVDTILARVTAAVATASGLSTHDTDIKALLSTVQTDLDNPSQYKADVSGLAPSGEYDTEMARITANVALASVLGALNSVAATGAVSDAKVAMSYIKQLVTLLRNGTYGLSALKTEIDANETKIDTVDTVVDGIQTDLSNASDGLTALKAAIDAIPTTAMRGTENAALAVDLEDAMQKATTPAYNQDTDSLEALRELLDTMVTSIAALQTDLDNPSQFMADLSTLETRLSAARAGYLDQLDFALQEAIAAIPTTMRGTDSAALASVLGALNAATATGAVDNLTVAMGYLKQLVTKLRNATDGLGALKTLIDAVKGVVDSIPTTAMRGTDNVVLAGPTKAEMDTGHGLLATEAKQDIIDGIVDTLLTRVTAAVATATALATVDGIVDNILIDTAVIGALGAGLSNIPWNASWDTEVESEVTDALNTYDPPTRTEATSDKDEVIAAMPTGYVHTDWKGNFSFTTGFGTGEIAISTLFSTNLALTTRRKYSVKLDLTAVETDGNFTELYLAVKEKIDGTNYRAIDRKTITKANIGTLAEPGIIIDIPATSENIQITLQMAVGLAANRTIYYAVVKEHLE